MQVDPIGVALYRNMASQSLAGHTILASQMRGFLSRKTPQYNQPYLYVGAMPTMHDDPLGLFWLYDCYKCFEQQEELEEALKECKNEWLGCKTMEEQIKFLDKYGD